MYTYSWFTLLYSRNQHNIVKQLYSSKDVKNKKKVYLKLYTIKLIVDDWTKGEGQK